MFQAAFRDTVVDGPSADRGVPRPTTPEFERAFGALLTKQGLVDLAGLSRARHAAEATAERFDSALVKLGLISEDDLTAAYAAFCGLTVLHAESLPKRAVLVDRLKPAFLRTHRILPISLTEEGLNVAVADPFATEPLEALRYQLDIPIKRVLISAGGLDTALACLYGTTATAEPTSRAGVDHLAAALDVNDLDVERLRDIANEAPVVRLVNQIIAHAAERRASDIHIEPGRDAVVVRYRIDGFLQGDETLDLRLRAALTTRIKIMANLDIAERRLPHDGRIKAVVRGVEIDIRVSTIPTAFGESIVMRLLDRTRVELALDRIGLSPDVHAGLRRLMNLPNGIVLVTGPTGSGKTTTLYAALNQLDRPGMKIFTVEDPVEYQIANVSQVQVQPQIGLDFPRALRSILRQDPDILMIGEIRDLETARIAVQAALTGHLVFSTLHTNTAVAAVTRLADIGVEPYLIAATLAGVMAQRLVRRLCQTCARPSEPVGRIAAEFQVEGFACESIDQASPREPIGCEACGGTGYSGRLVVSELLTVDTALRAAIAKGADEGSLAALAVNGGQRTLWADGLAKVAAGDTTLDEVLRVARAS